MSSMHGNAPRSADDYGQGNHKQLHQVLTEAEKPFPIQQAPQVSDVVLLIAQDINRLPLPIILDIGNQLEKYKDEIKTDHPGLSNALMLFHWSEEVIKTQTGG